MSTSQPDPPPSSRTPDPQASQSRQAQGSEGVPERNLLDRVLQETLSTDGARPEEMSALLDIARRYCGQPLTQHPVAVELVETLLRFRIAEPVVREPLRRRMAEQIAESLLDNPFAEERLQNFWNRLVEAVR